MANGLYDVGRDGFLNAALDWTNDDIRLALIDEDEDTPDLAADEDMGDRAEEAIVAALGASLGSKSSAAGVADANDATFSSVSGAESESIDAYLHTGTPADDTLIFNIDSATGLPVTPNGGDITVTWDNGANKIFKL